MAYDIRKVKTMTDLIGYFSQNLHWNIDVDDFDDIEDISYDFEAEDIGLKEEAFAKISSLRQLQPLVDGQRWGIFCVEFDSDKFEVTALRKILSGLVPKRRNSADHAVWDQKDLMFICNWGKDNNRTIGIAHFEDKDSGLPQIKMISCAPAMEDFTQIKVFEDRLAQLAFPRNTRDIDAWRESWASAFVSGYRQAIHDSVTLTVQLAAEAQNIRNRILDILEVESRNGYVHLLYEKFRNTLIHDMTESQFADMYAQTVVYGLFSARCMDKTQGNFSAEEAIDCIPNTNPFLKSLMKECLGSENNTKLSFDELEISNVVELLRNTRIEAIIQDFNRQTGGGREDPVIHFYEEFLTAYDKAQKVQRGVFYTPQPVVNFMVRAVDSIIKEQFGLRDGLASEETKKIKVKRKSYKKRAGQGYTEVEEQIDVPAIQVLDPATGTGTFLRQTILQIYENFKAKHKELRPDQLAAEWNKYVPEQLLPRLNGFELMMAPYAVAHMKLAMVLKDTGYDFSSDSRLKVFLTNTLEEAGSADDQISFFDDPLAIESVEANGAKKNGGINVVIGNPPYSGISSNNNEWISNLINDYKYINGVYFNERKHWLNDDYVKFIRFGEQIIDAGQYGILAYISNNGFLDNPTFRCMRYHLMRSFDDIYIVNLHGSAKKREVGPNGEKDENVFDIMQGVSINIFVKKSKHSALAKVHYKDIFGDRNKKYSILNSSSFTEFHTVNVQQPFYSFIPASDAHSAEYSDGFSPSDVYNIGSTGYLSGSDKTFVADDIPMLQSQLESAYGSSVDEEYIKEISYRPFDSKVALFVLKGSNISAKIKMPACYRTRYDVMKHFCSDNYAILIGRQGLAIGDIEWNLCFFTDKIADLNIFYRGGENVFPLYLYTQTLNGMKRTANLKPEFLENFAEKTKIRLSTEDHSDPGVLTLSDYIYAVLHSKKYRVKYREYLKLDLPKIPYPESEEYFYELASLGQKLRELHLMHMDCDTTDLQFLQTGSNLVEKPRFADGKIYINKSQYFYSVSEQIWNFYIGGYQPLQKWLKDRKNTILSLSDVKHYKQMITTIRHTIELMDAIDTKIKL